MRRIEVGTPCKGCARPLRSEGDNAPGTLVHTARGLCGHCRDTAKLAGTYHDYPRLTARSVDLVEDWEFLASQGYTRTQAAERMGIPKKRLEKAIERTRRRVVAA